MRQASLLGEKFVELAAPPDPAPGELTDGAVIPLERTNRNVEVEELLGLFEDWKPTAKQLKEVKFRLEAVRSKL